MYLYLPGAHAGVFNEAALEASKEIVLCESLIDALVQDAAGSGVNYTFCAGAVSTGTCM